MNLFERVRYIFLGAKREDRKTFLEQFDEEIEKKVIKDYMDGMTWIQLQGKYNTGSNIISRILKKYAVPRRNKSRTKGKK